MSKSTLNLIATIGFVFAAGALLATGSTVLGIVFAVCAAISIYQLLVTRRAR